MGGLCRTTSPPRTAYGARPVSVDLARNQRLTETPSQNRQSDASSPVAQALWLRLNHAQLTDQFALAHWPADQVIGVCSLAGGTGRTSLAGLFALTLAGLPYAHLHRSVALGELDPSPLSRCRTRWGAAPDLDHVAVTRAGGRVRILADIRAAADGRPVRVVDAPAGLVATIRLATEHPKSSVILLTRSDRASIADTAAALTWLQDVQGIDRRRLAVVINYGTGPADAGSRAAATAVGIRCRSVHRLPAHPALRPGIPLPSGHRMPRTVHRTMIRLCADVYNSIRPAADTSPPTLPNEDSDA